VAREVVSAIISVAPSHASYRSLASETSGYSYKAVQDYVEALERLYAAGVAYMKRGEGRVLYRREKKIFFRDPFLARVLAGWCGSRLLESALYEWVVLEHALRAFGEVYYSRDGLEVDVVAGSLKTEVKTGKPHRRSWGVTVLDKNDIPGYLLGMRRAQHQPRRV
jgi:predicted AAA+ superfamily ATPase